MGGSKSDCLDNLKNYGSGEISYDDRVKMVGKMGIFQNKM